MYLKFVMWNINSCINLSYMNNYFVRIVRTQKRTPRFSVTEYHALNVLHCNKTSINRFSIHHRSIIIKVSKKGNLSDCNNWRGITLLSVLGNGKVLCLVLLRRLEHQVDAHLGEEQAAFRKRRSCNNQFLTLRQCFSTLVA